MVEFVQDLLRVDAAAARFATLYLCAIVVLLAASAVYARVVPGRPEPRAEGARARRAGKDVLGGFIHWLASRRITPNQVTWIGLGLVLFNCAYFLHHRDTFLFGTGLIVAFLFDSLDGAVARAQGSSSKFGAYLDAVIDRYQEIATYLAIGLVTEMWLAAFLVITGSMLTSYNKARAAIEIPVDNKGWPDLLGKGVRVFCLCCALIGDGVLPWLLPATLYALAVMTHFTAAQRIIRGYLLIRQAEDAS
jgi:CDP-diacylglycerol--glycerol-3-phosphate 3-phosphatidyltransferase